ncbi:MULTISPECIES: hybrid sensor histidine kinase/response regulator transcription factor [unclassified Bacillus (in: firmicutes)]|uniref:helix-turn-helix transcriptional regulator n=1 Tax=unclassified Bacillus (in: firmicutes) TaxID=185979 RepID=UPI0008F39171|nr:MULTISPECIES: hybrid sensor histidine kinase/response regulator transcription factor [unclassified Bacillus (in: firmicutes)]SFK13590.1 DNA-binding response regulator, NarL/FixJ family, contains REC and HTH domains [Bacillus sp. 71mf]SFT24210.1 DNA-binding response regulator, NarL/FixJ family, contains REC and HTH domains [Bacillus sp. 103mf]
MISVQNKLLWQHWPIVFIRIFWIAAVTILTYQDNPTFPFEIVFGMTLILYVIPVILYKIRYELYLLAEIILVGGLSLYLAYTYHLAQFFSPAILTLAFFCRGKANFYILPLTIIVYIFGVFLNSDYQLNHLPVNIFDVLFIYGIGHVLQRIVFSMDSIKQKLELIKEKNAILEQYSSQVERMTLLEERCRMARELHDTVGYKFTSVILSMETLKPHLTTEEGKKKLQDILDMSRSGLESIRRQIHEMDPLEEVNLDVSLLNIIEEFRSNTHVDVIFRTIGEQYTIAKKVKMTFCRCLQEAMTNATRHGEAESIQVLLQYHKSHVMLQVQDNGKGIEYIQEGFGLSGMRNRLNEYQGSLYIDSQKNVGTIVTCVIPSLNIEKTPTQDEINILIVDDQSMVLDSLQLLLTEYTGFHVTVANSGRQALEKCEVNQPDIVLMDVQMPDMNGIITTEEIKRKWPNIKVIMVTTFEESSSVSEALKAGAEGYVLKSAPPKELVAAIRLVNSGGTMLSQGVANRLFNEYGSIPKKYPYELTRREIEVLGALKEGLRYKEISQKLFLSEGTVRNYASSIYMKLKVSGRSEAVKKADEEALL